MYLMRVLWCAFNSKTVEKERIWEKSFSADLKTTRLWMTGICYYIYLEEEDLVKYSR